MAASKTDSQHRIRSTRGCVAAPIFPCFLFLSDRLYLSHTGYTAPQHSTTNWQTHVQCLVMPSRCPWHQSINPTREAIHTGNTIIYLPGLQTRQNALEKRADTRMSNLHLFPTMPTTVCVSAQNRCPVGQRQLSAPWTALTLQGATTALYFTPKWLASWPQRLHTRIQNYCGTRGDYRLQ